MLLAAGVEPEARGREWDGRQDSQAAGGEAESSGVHRDAAETAGSPRGRATEGKEQALRQGQECYKGMQMQAMNILSL